MSTAEALAESVKAAISGGHATSATVTTLQSLLSSASGAPPTKPASTSQDSRTARTTARTAKPTKTARAPAKGARKDQAFKVLEDEPRSLAPKARYALATEVVNIALKVLTDASRELSRYPARRPSAQNQDTPRRLSVTPASKRALQVRSGNETPVTQSSPKQPGPRRRPSQCSLSGVSLGRDLLVSTGECARFCFSFLRSVDFQKLGLREPPKLQLETGMLALCGKLVALELHSLAGKELRAVKKRLETIYPSRQPAKGVPTKAQQGSEIETLSSLLQLSIDFESCLEAYALIVNLQLYTMQLIAASHKPGPVEEIQQFLESNSPTTPTNLILRLVADGDKAKASKQLLALSRAILQLCPNVASSADEIARDRTRHPAPETIFKLQAVSLLLRREASRLSNSILDVEKELVEPLSRCMAALVRRIPAQEGTSAVFEACKDAYEALKIAETSMTEDSPSKFTIFRTLSVLAERAASQREALLFAEGAFTACTSLEKDHARFVAALVRKTAARLMASVRRHSVDDLCADMNTICESLQKSLSGSASDYETLFAELADVITNKHVAFQAEYPETMQKQFAVCVGGFVSSYTHVFPNKNINIAQEVVQVAISRCGSNEAALGWVTKDTAKVFIQSGVLRRIADKFSSRPALLAWTSFSSAITFGRILKLVLVKAASTQSKDLKQSIVDDENLDSEERGALLEWQLKCACELAHKPKYQAGLKILLPEYFKSLAAIYSLEFFPLRRARVATQAHCTREQFPELIAPHHLAALTGMSASIDGDNLSNDQNLAAYASSIKASLGLAAAFCNGRPSTNEVHPSLVILETHINSIDATSPDWAIDNSSLLHAQLSSLCDYLEMQGDDASRLQAAKLLFQFGNREQSWSPDPYDAVTRLSRAYISLGYAEKAGKTLSKAGDVCQVDPSYSLGQLDFLLCRAEYLLAIQDLDSCQKALDLLNQARSGLETNVPRALHTSRFRLLLGRAWVLASRWMLINGSAHDSLFAAKRAVKIMNSIWSGLDRSEQGPSCQVAESTTGTEDAAVENVTNKVSKLILRPEDDGSTGHKNQRKGAAFWPVATLMCRALMHLADVYRHHGVFNEANYSSEQAVKFAEAIDSNQLLSQVRYHRSILLTTAGRLEAAELCLAHDSNEDKVVSPLVQIAALRAKAALSSKIGDLQEAVDFYEQAQVIVKDIKSETYVASIERVQEAEVEPRAETSIRAEAQRQLPENPTRKKPTTQQPRSKTVSSRAASAGRGEAKTAGAGMTQRKPPPSPVSMLERLEAAILLDKALVSMRLGRADEESLARLKILQAPMLDLFKQWRLEHESIMHRVYSELQADFSFNVLPESTLSFPALQALDRRLSALDAKGLFVPSSFPIAPVKTVKRSKGAKPAQKSATPLKDLLSAARRCIAPESSRHMQMSTSQTHSQFALMANASMVLSATCASHATEVLHPMQEAMTIDQGKSNASECYLTVAKVDQEGHAASDPLAWPNAIARRESSPLTATCFRDQYIDLLPKPWTAISMNLSETCDELYITRYRRAQSPLILRLPFSRQKTDEADEEVFDFHMGKEELKEIIELSDYSCHNSLDTKAKGAKTNWWNEREALDRRLQELLINIENIWLGGFKGMFSRHQPEGDQLDRFRKSFEAIMDRHLPSRRSIKKGSKKLALDDQILELFIGMGSDQDGQVDLDESLADLLYFIVDILQFNGERNAYDEIDFDSMAIDVLDALRTYHDTVDEQNIQHAHLILVLDKRLQAFPWESLPCMENSSVSRVDSMLTLRDRLAQMVRQADGGEDGYKVSIRSGSYILNPSSDLKSTETTLGPALSKLAKSNEPGWTSIVDIAPSEVEFRTSLSNSSMLLYFGHGAGSQYISQRTIRRLDKCSEVVWLMGCSSGAATEHDELEPAAVPLAYLAAGQASAEERSSQHDRSKCMAVISTLWDVTDKDIDRFSLAVGEEWGLWESEQESAKLPAKTPRKREKLAVPSTPERTAKTPKTPKVRNTPAPARTPARSRSRPRCEAARKQSLVEAVAKSRDACYLRYLNGAAPVVYGVPVYLGH